MSAALSVTATVSSTLSMAGSLSIMFVYVRQPKAIRKNLGERMVSIASSLDFLASLFFSFGPSFLPAKSEDPSGACEFQGFMLQWMLASIMWNAVMAANFYCLIVLRVDARRLRRMLKYEAAAVIIGCLIIAFVLLGVGAYGDAGLWCWVSSSNPGVQLGAFYSFVIVAWASSVVALVAIARSRYRGEGQTQRKDGNDGGGADGAATTKKNKRMLNATEMAADASARAVQGRLTLYISAFVFIWMFGLINRVTGAVVLGTSGRPVFATAFLHVLFVPCQGSFNALIYHGYADALAEAISNFVNKNNFWTRRKHHGFAASSSSPSSCSSLRAAAASAAATARSLFFAPNNGNNRNEGTSDGNVVGDSDLSGIGVSMVGGEGLLVTPRTEVGAADSASLGEKEADNSAVSAVAGGQKHHLAALMKLQTEALVSGGWGCARLSNTGSSSSSKNQTEKEMKGDGAVEGTTNNASGGDSNNGSIGGGGGGGTRTLFVTTYNLGEALLDNQNDDSNNVNGECSGGTSGGGSGVSTWVPLGYDVYAIGVQECMDLPSLRAKIAAHLNSSSSSSSDASGSASGEGYVMYTREMGSTVTGLGFHGMIALTIFVRSSDVNSGAVKVLCGAKVETATAAAPMTVAGAAGAAVAAVGEKKVAEGDKSSSSSSSLAAAAALRPIVTMGQRLPGGLRAPNKGSVGIAVNVLGSPIAFLTAHFASDSGGKLRLKDRNDHAAMLLGRTVLGPQEVGCDVHLAHHHTFVFGDFNYRSAGEEDPEKVLDLVFNAHQTAFDQAAAAAAAAAPPQLMPGTTPPSHVNNHEEVKVGDNDPAAWRLRRWQRLSQPTLSIMNDQSSAASSSSLPLVSPPPRPPSLPRAEKEKEKNGEAAPSSSVKVSSTGCGGGVVGSSSNETSAWASLLLLDELSKCQKLGAAFSGFTEQPITFPPSFRRRRNGGGGGNAGGTSGAASDSGTAAAAGSASGAGGASGLETMTATSGAAASGWRDRAGLAKLYVVDLANDNDGGGDGVDEDDDDDDDDDDNDDNDDDDDIDVAVDDCKDGTTTTAAAAEEALGEDDVESGTGALPKMAKIKQQQQNAKIKKKKKKTKKKLRPPSYCDRVLVHSLPDAKKSLRVLAYDSCESMQQSDHKPVALTALLGDSAAAVAEVDAGGDNWGGEGRGSGVRGDVSERGLLRNGNPIIGSTGVGGGASSEGGSSYVMVEVTAIFSEKTKKRVAASAVAITVDGSEVDGDDEGVLCVDGSMEGGVASAERLDRKLYQTPYYLNHHHHHQPAAAEEGSAEPNAATTAALEELGSDRGGAGGGGGGDGSSVLASVFSLELPPLPSPSGGGGGFGCGDTSDEDSFEKKDKEQDEGGEGSGPFEFVSEKVETVELLFPLGAEDPFLADRSLVAVAAEAIGGHSRKGAKHQPKATFSVAGTTSSTTATITTMPLSDVFAGSVAMDAKHFFSPGSGGGGTTSGHGASGGSGGSSGGGKRGASGATTATTTTTLCAISEVNRTMSNADAAAPAAAAAAASSFSLHALLRLVDGKGATVAAGIICLADVVAAHQQAAAAAAAAALLAPYSSSPSPSPVLKTTPPPQPLPHLEPLKVRVELTCGGQRRGWINVAVTCKNMERLS